MKSSAARLLSLSLAALWAAGCQSSNATPPAATAAQAPADTGGSLKGDLGEPVGPPVRAILTDAPQVPPPTGRKAPAKVLVELEVVEKVMRLADGVDYTFWTFGGKVPGKFIRVRQGDTVEFTLKNDPSSKLPHNIDLHAVTGPGGGAAASFTAPGKATRFTFKALNQGLYVYHCATAPVGMHIANGMYGLIYVEPPEGLAPVDHEYYVMQGDFYTVGKYHEKGLQPFDQEKAIDEKPTYVVFNGAEGALTGANALKAKVGEKVRLFMGNGGPNLVSSFHVIGEIFDRVYTEGGTRYQENVQTTLIPAGGSAIVEYHTEVPGNLALVDHSIFRTFNKGALGLMKVEGKEDEKTFSRQGEVTPSADPEARPPQPPPPAAFARQPEPGEELAAAPQTPAAQPVAAAVDAHAAGEKVFTTNCASCHQANGQGLPGVFPPLAKSDFLMADKLRAVGVLLHGLNGPVKVNGTTYNNMMPSMAHLTDDEIAHVLSYVRNSFGNKGDKVTPAEVAQLRGGGSSSVAGEH